MVQQFSHPGEEDEVSSGWVARVPIQVRAVEKLIIIDNEDQIVLEEYIDVHSSP